MIFWRELTATRASQSRRDDRRREELTRNKDGVEVQFDENELRHDVPAFDWKCKEQDGIDPAKSKASAGSGIAARGDRNSHRDDTSQPVGCCDGC